MAEQSPNPLGLPPTVWVTLIVACAGVLALKQGPFQDSRPRDAPVASYRHASSDAQYVEARLWQDPLAAADSARSAEEAAMSSADPLAHVVPVIAAAVAALPAPQRDKPTAARAAVGVPFSNPPQHAAASGGKTAPSTQVRPQTASDSNQCSEGGNTEPAADQSAPEGPHTVGTLRRTVDDYARDTSGLGKVLLLAALVSGAPYADDVENRRRTRYAVLAGLYRAGYLPVDSEHVGYVTLSEFYSDRKNPHDLAAFEWLERDRATTGIFPARVLLLWLDQDGFRDCPLSRISRLAAAIAPNANSAPGSPTVLSPDGAQVLNGPGAFSLAILGPYDSDGLRAMATELQWRQTKRQPFARTILVYSPRATAADDSVIEAATPHGPPPESNAAGGTSDHDAPITATASSKAVSLSDRFDQWSHHGVALYRTVSDDETVGKAVRAKLKARDVAPGEIALIAERDTLYARLMGKYFGGCNNPPRPDPTTVVPDASSKPTCVTYLRGLDGVSPPVIKQAPSGADTANTSSRDPGTAHVLAVASPDAATGQSQLDYLRRIAESLAAQQGNGHYIKAIGVLSSDIYDKLLVLQALRPSFPDVIFFTFDLDARLIDRENLPWTHQLLVGSSLGLALSPELQGDIPEFRDSYQTTTFFTTLLLIHQVLPTAAAAAAPTPLGGLEWTHSALVYEIGRTQAFDLTVNTSDGKSCDLDKACAWIAKTRTSAFFSNDSHRLLFLAEFGAAVLLLVVPWIALGNQAMRNSLKHRVGLSVGNPLNTIGARVCLCWIVATVILIWTWPTIIESLTIGKTLMPIPIFDGTSRWGSTALEIAVIAASLALVYRGQRKLRENAETMRTEFGFLPTLDVLMNCYAKRLGPWYSEAHLAELCWFPFAKLSDAGLALAGPHRYSPLELLIAQYLYRGKAVKRLIRVGVATVASALVWTLLDRIGISFFGGVAWYSTQLRQHGWAGGLAILSLIAMQFLIFWVADAMLLTRSFVLALNHELPAWPVEALKKWQQGLPLNQATLWLNLKLVARRTSWVSNLIWYPSLVIAGMFAAVFTIKFGAVRFANNPVELVISITMTIAAAVLLRRSAEILRADVISRLENLRFLQLSGGTHCPNAIAQLDRLIDRVVNLRSGAFAPYSEQPLVRAVLVPLITFGATAGLPYLRLGG